MPIIKNFGSTFQNKACVNLFMHIYFLSKHSKSMCKFNKTYVQMAQFDKKQKHFELL